MTLKIGDYVSNALATNKNCIYMIVAMQDRIGMAPLALIEQRFDSSFNPSRRRKKWLNVGWLRKVDIASYRKLKQSLEDLIDALVLAEEE